MQQMKKNVTTKTMSKMKKLKIHGSLSRRSPAKLKALKPPKVTKESKIAEIKQQELKK